MGLLLFFGDDLHGWWMKKVGKRGGGRNCLQRLFKTQLMEKIELLAWETNQLEEVESC